MKPCTVWAVYDGSRLGVRAEGGCVVPPGGPDTYLQPSNDPAKAMRALVLLNDAYPGRYTEKHFQADLENHSGPVRLTSWKNENELVRLRVDYPGDGGSHATEVHYDFEKMAVVEGTSAEPDGMPSFKGGNQYYFDDGKMFEWVDASGQSIAPGSEAFRAKEREVLASERTIKAKYQAEVEKTWGPIQTFTGTFLGMEEGDNAYLDFKSGDETISLVIRQTDEVVYTLYSEPDAYLGKEVTVTWRRLSSYCSYEAGECFENVILTAKLPE